MGIGWGIAAEKHDAIMAGEHHFEPGPEELADPALELMPTDGGLHRLGAHHDPQPGGLRLLAVSRHDQHHGEAPGRLLLMMENPTVVAVAM